MLNFFYNRRKIKKSQKLLKLARSIINKNGVELEPAALASLKEKTFVLESSINEGNIDGIEAAHDSLEKSHKATLSKFQKSKLRQNVESVLLALLLALIIRTFIVQPFKIPSASMVPTLLVGDHLLVNKFIYGTKVPFTEVKILPLREIERGDVVVFRFTDRDFGKERNIRDVHYIKRVIGVSGDRIDIKGRNIYINDKKISQVFDSSHFYYEKGIEVKTDRYVTALGSHKFDVIYKSGLLNTKRGKIDFPVTVPEGEVFVMGDNRDNSYDGRYWGFLPSAYVLGKAFVIHWSWEDNFSIRWDRIFSSID